MISSQIVAILLFSMLHVQTGVVGDNDVDEDNQIPTEADEDADNVPGVDITTLRLVQAVIILFLSGLWITRFWGLKFGPIPNAQKYFFHNSRQISQLEKKNFFLGGGGGGSLNTNTEHIATY